MPSEFTELHQNQCKNPKFSARHAPRPLYNGFASTAPMFFNRFCTINSYCTKLSYSGHPPFSKQGSHSHGKSWKKVLMKSHGKVMEDSKNSEFHGNLFCQEKSHGKVMEISCPNKVGGADGCKGRRRPLFCNINFSEQ